MPDLLTPRPNDPGPEDDHDEIQDRENWGQTWSDDGRVIDIDAGPGEGESPPPEAASEPKAPTQPTEPATPPQDGSEEPKAPTQPTEPATPPQDGSDEVAQLRQELDRFRIEAARREGAESFRRGMSDAEGAQRLELIRAELDRDPDIGDIEEAMSDPHRFQEALRAYAQRGYERARFDMEPALQAVNRLLETQPAIIQVAEEAAWRETARQLDAAGIKDHANYRQRVLELIADSSQGNPGAAMQHRMSPESLTAGVRYLRDQEGRPAPVKDQSLAPPATPPSDSGGQKATTKTPAMIRAERNFGVTFSPEEVDLLASGRV